MALALAGSAHAAQPQFRFAQKPIDGQYIVVLRDDAAALASERSVLPRVADVARQMALQHGVRVSRSYSHALRGFVVKADVNTLGRLLHDRRVAYIEEDGYVSIGATQVNATWGIDRSDQRDLPLDGTYTYVTTAANVNTYIIDTGVLGSHAEFTGRMIGGYTAISDGNGTNDCNGHGTHVAGSVAGTTYGIAKSARISPIRVLGCNGSGTNSGVIAGMDWVVANHVKPAVANMSLGGGASTATDDAVARMSNAGVTVVVAAGNDNLDACNYSPARAPSAITVGSTTNTDARSSFSNWGTCLDIFAPGSSILSAWHTSNTATNTISGTSMAAPHAAGVAALFLANNPAATPAEVTTALLNASTINKVTSPGTNSPNRLLYSLFSTTTPDTTPPSTASATPPNQRAHFSPGFHQGASTASGSRFSRMTGPLVSTPRPIATARSAKPRRRPSAADRMPCTPTSTQNASITSNITAVENRIHSSVPISTSAASPPRPGCCGHRRRPSATVSSSPPAENSGSTRRGHQSLTPNSAQPAWNIQNMNGGLWS